MFEPFLALAIFAASPSNEPVTDCEQAIEAVTSQQATDPEVTATADATEVTFTSQETPILRCETDGVTVTVWSPTHG